MKCSSSDDFSLFRVAEEYAVFQSDEPCSIPDPVVRLINTLTCNGFTPLTNHCCERWWEKPGFYVWTAPIVHKDESGESAKRARFT
jgi:hypothetical protein